MSVIDLEHRLNENYHAYQSHVEHLKNEEADVLTLDSPSESIGGSTVTVAAAAESAGNSDGGRRKRVLRQRSSDLLAAKYGTDKVMQRAIQAAIDSSMQVTLSESSLQSLGTSCDEQEAAARQIDDDIKTKTLLDNVDFDQQRHLLLKMSQSQPPVSQPMSHPSDVSDAVLVCGCCWVVFVSRCCASRLPPNTKLHAISN